VDTKRKDTVKQLICAANTELVAVEATLLDIQEYVERDNLAAALLAEASLKLVETLREGLELLSVWLTESEGE